MPGRHDKVLLGRAHQLSQHTVGWSAQPPGCYLSSDRTMLPVRKIDGTHPVPDAEAPNGFADRDDFAGAIRHWNERRLHFDMIVAVGDGEVAIVQGHSLHRDH